MIKPVNSTDNTGLVQKPQNQNNQQSISCKGNNDLERTPANDSFQKNNKTAEIVTGSVGILALFIGLCAHKGTKVLNGKKSTLGEKIITGFKNLFKKNEHKVEQKVQSAAEGFRSAGNRTENRISGKTRKHNRNYENTTEKFNKNKKYNEQNRFEQEKDANWDKPHKYNPKKEQPKITEHNIQRQLEEDAVIDNIEPLAEAPTKEQRMAINKNNKAAKKAASKANTIRNLIPESIAERLDAVPQTELNQTANKIKELEGNIKALQRKIEHNARVGKDTKGLQRAIENNNKKLAEVKSNVIKAAKAQKPLAQAAEVDKKLLNDLKSCEGRIRSLKQKIAGAKKFSKSTEKLEKELANSRKQLAELKGSIAKKHIEIPTENSAVAERIRKGFLLPQPAVKPAGINSNATDTIATSFRKTAQYEKNMEYVQEKINGAKNTGKQAIGVIQKGTQAETQNFNIMNYKNIAFNELPGQHDASGIIRHFDSKGKLIRTLIDEGNGIIRICETNHGNPVGGIEFLFRDGKLVKKNDNTKHVQELKKLAHEIRQSNDKSAVRGMIDCYADKCGMERVNKTVRVGNGSVKIIYEGFGYDISADGRILAKQYAESGKLLSHQDKTNLLSGITEPSLNHNTEMRTYSAPIQNNRVRVHA